MKKVSLCTLFVVLLLLLTGCVSESYKNQIPTNLTEGSYTELNVFYETYITDWKTDYNYETPIEIKNSREFKRFFKEHNSDSDNGIRIKETYDNEFFDEYVFYAYIEDRRTSLEGKADIKTELYEDELKILINKASWMNPQDETNVVSAVVHLFGVSKDDVKDVKKVEMINNIQ